MGKEIQGRARHRPKSINLMNHATGIITDVRGQESSLFISALCPLCKATGNGLHCPGPTQILS